MNYPQYSFLTEVKILENKEQMICLSIDLFSIPLSDNNWVLQIMEHFYYASFLLGLIKICMLDFVVYSFESWRCVEVSKINSIKI